MSGGGGKEGRGCDLRKFTGEMSKLHVFWLFLLKDIIIIPRVDLFEHHADVTPVENVPQQAVGQVFNPFVLTLLQESEATLKSESIDL